MVQIWRSWLNRLLGGQACDWWTYGRTHRWTDRQTDRQTDGHTQTHAGNDNTRRPKLASGKNPLPIAESRTGQPAMVTLMIKLNCPTVHDTTLRANIFVRSYLGCGTDSVSMVFLQVSQIFQRRKSDGNKQGFEIKLNLTCQFNQSTPKTLGILLRFLTKIFCTSGPNLVILA